MSICFNELVDRNFNFRFKATAYTSAEIALRSFEELKYNNKDFFTISKGETVFGNLLSYSFNKQFYDSAFNANSCYNSYFKRVSNNVCSPLFIETEDFLINIGKTTKHGLLPSKAQYKLNFAKSNTDIEQQLMFDFTKDSVKIISHKKYALLAYGYRAGTLTHLNIVFPNSTYTSSMYNPIDLLKEVHLYTNFMQEDEVEENIVSLKKTFSQEIIKKVL